MSATVKGGKKREGGSGFVVRTEPDVICAAPVNGRERDRAYTQYSLYGTAYKGCSPVLRIIKGHEGS